MSTDGNVDNVEELTKNNASANDGDSGKGDDKSNAGNEYDIEKVKVEDLPPETQKIIKGFQASYTKEKQALKQKETEINEIAKEAQTWKDWAAKEKSKIEEFNEWKRKQLEKGSTTDGDDEVDDDGSNSAVIDPKEYRKIAQEESSKRADELDKKYGATANMLVQMMKLQQNHPDFKIDPQRVLDYAQENQIPDIDKAFQGAYQEDIIQKKINDAVAEREQELKNKYDAKVHDLSMPGRTPRKVIARDRN